MRRCLKLLLFGLSISAAPSCALAGADALITRTMGDRSLYGVLLDRAKNLCADRAGTSEIFNPAYAECALRQSNALWIVVTSDAGMEAHGIVDDALEECISDLKPDFDAVLTCYMGRNPWTDDHPLRAE